MSAYYAKDVTVTVNGFVLTGFGPDTFVTYTQESMDGQAVRGADGLVAYAIDRALPLVSMSFTLMQTSAGNDIMSGLLALQKSGVAPLIGSLIVSGSRESIQWPSCVITKAPDGSLSQSIEGREWTITGQAVIRPGGSIL